MPLSFSPPQQQHQSPFTHNSPFSQETLQQQQLQLHHLHVFLFTNDQMPATYSTKWADLHPNSQNFLLHFQERILEHRDESQWIDHCDRLYDSSVFNDGFQLDSSHISQELGGISTAMDRQKTQLHELKTSVKDKLCNTEIAVRSFKRFDFYRGLPRKPSPFLQKTVVRFEKYIGECRQWIEKLEQLLKLEPSTNALNSSSSLLQSLPKVLTNVHDFFLHVAAKVERTHQYMESMKKAYLAEQRRRGHGNDPFLEADRREKAKLAAAASRVHPTLHLPANSQQSSEVAVFFAASSETPAPYDSGSTLFVTPAATRSAPLLFSSPTTPDASPQPSVSGSFIPTSTTINTPLFVSTSASGASSFSTPIPTSAATRSTATVRTSPKWRAKIRPVRR